MNLWRKFTNMIVEKKIILGKGAKMVVTSDAGVQSTIDMAELAAIDSIGAADLAKIDGITNGTGAAGKALVLDSSGNVTMPTSGSIDERNAEVVTAANVIAAAENGRTYYLNSATEFASTLPAPALGLKFKFIVKAAPSGADYTITTTSSANIIYGAISSSDLNAANDAAIATGNDTISFVSAKAIVGDWVEFESDGTNWYVSGNCSVFDAITATTAS